MSDGSVLEDESVAEVLQSSNELLNDFQASPDLGADDELLAPSLQRALDEQIEKVRNTLLSKGVRDSPSYADVLECHSHLTDLWIQRVGKPAMCALDRDKDGTVTADELAGDALSEEKELLSNENRELRLINERLEEEHNTLALRVDQLTTALQESEQRVTELTRDLNHITEEHCKVMSDLGSPAVLIGALDPGDGKDLEEDDVVLSPTQFDRPLINKDVKSMEEEVESLELTLKQERRERMAELTLAQRQRLLLDSQVQGLTKTLMVLRKDLKELNLEVDTLNNDVDVFIAELVEKDHLIELMQKELDHHRMRASTHHVGYHGSSTWSVMSGADDGTLEEQMSRMKSTEEFDIGMAGVKRSGSELKPIEARSYHSRQASQSVMINQNMSAMCLARLKSAQSMFMSQKLERMDSTKMFESLKQQYELQHSRTPSTLSIGKESAGRGSVVTTLLSEEAADLDHIPEDGEHESEFDGKLTSNSPSYSLSTTPYSSPQKGKLDEDEGQSVADVSSARERSTTEVELAPDEEDETQRETVVVVPKQQSKAYEVCSLVELEARVECHRRDALNAQLREKCESLEIRMKEMQAEQEQMVAQLREMKERTRDSYVTKNDDENEDNAEPDESQALLAGRKSSNSTNNIDVIDEDADQDAACVCFYYRLW